MKQIFQDYLFTKGILVKPQNTPILDFEGQVAVMLSLAQQFSIRIKSQDAEFLDIRMIDVAARNLGRYVPAPFYRNFPMSVKEMTGDQLIYDQLLLYAQTYGMGWFDEPGHSIFEGETRERLRILEGTSPKEFRVLTETRALHELRTYALDMLSGNRPLSQNQKDIVLEAYTDGLLDLLGSSFTIPCKETAVFLYCETGHPLFATSLRLQDTIKILDYIQYNRYNSENLKKLNLKNQDRKLITDFIGTCFIRCAGDERFPKDIRECFEKRKIWCGLLHHIHYKPVCANDRVFVNNIRSGKNISAYSTFELAMREGQPRFAAELLKKNKGATAVARNLNYILSRCKMNEIEEVLKCLED